MNPLFTVHAGEYLVGSHIEEHDRHWNVWVPSKDTGIDLLVTDSKNRKSVSFQVKYSKDHIPTARRESSIKDRLMATGWWTLDGKKIDESHAEFWVFVLPSFFEHGTSFIIIPRSELLGRLHSIPGHDGGRIQLYFCVTKSTKSAKSQCWEHRGLSDVDLKKIGDGCFSDKRRDFPTFLNAWGQIEKELEEGVPCGI
jgi:hypothetical protein